MNERSEQPMTPNEVASLFGVSPKTVTRWARAGKLTSFRTPGGHRRFVRTEVMERFHEGRNDRRV